MKSNRSTPRSHEIQGFSWIKQTTGKKKKRENFYRSIKKKKKH